MSGKSDAAGQPSGNDAEPLNRPKKANPKNRPRKANPKKSTLEIIVLFMALVGGIICLVLLALYMTIQVNPLVYGFLMMFAAIPIAVDAMKFEQQQTEITRRIRCVVTGMITMMSTKAFFDGMFHGKAKGTETYKDETEMIVAEIMMMFFYVVAKCYDLLKICNKC